jgi:hypothetical protein
MGETHLTGQATKHPAAPSRRKIYYPTHPAGQATKHPAAPSRRQKHTQQEDTMTEFHYNTIPEALDALRQGRIILVTDDEDRENEGDLICAAEFATTENINFMARYAKGLICTPMSADIAKHLGLTPMVAVNTDNHETAFTQSVDLVDTTTGISAKGEETPSAPVPAERLGQITFAAQDILFHWLLGLVESLHARAIPRQPWTCAAWQAWPSAASAVRLWQRTER